jgi:zinc/manganese transport system substrate-binding protein
MHKILFAFAFLCCVAPAQAAISVFACEPEWARLAAELGGDKVEVFAATTGRQDPHQIQARPALIAKLRQADLLVCTGAELEAGWLPVLLRQGANPRVQPGGQGWFAAADHVELQEKPARLDRAEGDVHAAGNPHIQTDPRNLKRVAEALTQRLTQIDGANAAAYRQRGADFQAKWSAAITRWETAAAALKGAGIVESHKSWVYMLDWLGMRSMGTIEPKPGVPPSSGHLAQLIADISARGPKMILYAAYQDARPARFVGEKSGLPAVELPFTVGGNDAAKDLFALFDDTVAKLNAGISARR